MDQDAINWQLVSHLFYCENIKLLFYLLALELISLPFDKANIELIWFCKYRCFKYMNSLGFDKSEKDTKVVVAMSGGVDSSVAAVMLKNKAMM